MRNKKIITMLAALALVGVVGAGSTLAYLTDTTDTVENVFTVGNVNVKVEENFEQNSLLMPVTGSAKQGTLKGGIKKEVYVTGEKGSQPAYVRVQIAIPDVLDDGDPTFDAARNVLHFNYSDAADYNWNWYTSSTSNSWNAYKKTIDGVDYNVYVVTYMNTLAAEEKTKYPAMHQVYLDSKVTSSDVEKINKELGENWKILVVAEAVQAANFDDPFTALNAAFGTPSTDNSPFKDTVKKAETSTEAVTSTENQ